MQKLQCGFKKVADADSFFCGGNLKKEERLLSFWLPGSGISPVSTERTHALDTNKPIKLINDVSTTYAHNALYHAVKLFNVYHALFNADVGVMATHFISEQGIFSMLMRNRSYKLLREMNPDHGNQRLPWDQQHERKN